MCAVEVPSNDLAPILLEPSVSLEHESGNSFSWYPLVVASPFLEELEEVWMRTKRSVTTFIYQIFISELLIFSPIADSYHSEVQEQTWDRCTLILSLCRLVLSCAAAAEAIKCSY